MLIRAQNDFKQLLQSLHLGFCTPGYKRYSSNPSLALLKRVHVYDRSRVGRLHPTQLRKAYAHPTTHRKRFPIHGAKGPAHMC